MVCFIIDNSKGSKNKVLEEVRKRQDYRYTRIKNELEDRFVEYKNHKHKMILVWRTPKFGVYVTVYTNKQREKLAEYSMRNYFTIPIDTTTKVNQRYIV